MKIEGSGANQVSKAEQAVQAERSESSRAAARSGAEGDRLNVSTDAQFITEAVRAANQAPDVRRDVVERAKAKLAAGELGSDPFKLADKIIDDLAK